MEESVENALMGSSLDAPPPPPPPPLPLPLPLPLPPLTPWVAVPPGALVPRPSRHLVSIWTCSKLCTVCFVAGIFVGYALNRRVRRWLAKMLKKLNDDD